MDWDLRSDLPIYSQLTERLTHAIIAGELLPGARLPSVRELALEAGVNPNTVQRALTELERQGLVFAHRTAGRFVTEDTAMIGQARLSQARERVTEFLSVMRRQGYTKSEILALIEGTEEEESI